MNKNASDCGLKACISFITNSMNGPPFLGCSYIIKYILSDFCSKNRVFAWKCKI
jgi:hypothetical protein